MMNMSNVEMNCYELTAGDLELVSAAGDDGAFFGGLVGGAVGAVVGGLVGGPAGAAIGGGVGAKMGVDEGSHLQDKVTK